MTESTKITVLLPVKNTDTEHLVLAMESIRKQTFGDWVCVVINDGYPFSTEICRIIDGDERFQLIQNTGSRNLAEALNIGLKLVETPFVARMDADDIAGVSRFEKQMAEFEKEPELFLVGSSLSLIDEAGTAIGELKYPSTYSEIKRKLIYRNPFAHPSVMIRKSLFEMIGYYDERYFQCEDLELWLRVIAKDLPCKNIDESLVQYRVSGKYERSSRNWVFNLRARVHHFRWYYLSDWMGVVIASLKVITPALILRAIFDSMNSKE